MSKKELTVVLLIVAIFLAFAIPQGVRGCKEYVRQAAEATKE